ncbi:DNA-(apurinic or apyrimidinic site) lyase 1 [Tolypocladium ophioglossoides CBS 100239]|uniref:Apurinic-apyrimidinic endonuclease 1 n=1 Tax=Tolypocladium ophioglossoides (strain CBS 100239) TaxID=1163406 RepID=A0A0L0N8L2_TOLOC|nr:DNA-(apurinic or apyrimidinic site) lyase 1 [Tolypocladium ophioglossoides CBS 100239]
MPRSSPRKKPAINYSEDADVKPSAAKPSAAAKALANIKEAASKADAEVVPKRKAEAEAEPGTNGEASKAPKKRKTQAGKDAASMPLAERTAVSSLKKAMYIGAHVSAAGGTFANCVAGKPASVNSRLLGIGVQNSITNAAQIGANSFALFLKPQRKWANPPLAAEARDLFISGCTQHSYSAAAHALPHGSYLVNLAQADEAKAVQAYCAFVDDLLRCEQLSIRLYNFHPGSTLGDARTAAIARIAAQLNKAHKATKTVVTVLENMAGSGNIIGSTWEDLRDIIALLEDKDRVGVCIDTCHAFAAGHDLRTPAAFKSTIDSFNEVVGAEYLKAFHLNDSKAPFNSNRDLHANIGTGFLGLRAFHSIMNHDAFRNMPMVLETPIDRKDPDGKTVEDKQVWADEIKLLESLIGMDPDGDVFRATEKELQARGAWERSKIQGQVDKKSAKDAKKGSRGIGGKAGGKRKKKVETDDESG